SRRASARPPRSSARPAGLRLASATVLAASLAFVSACGGGDSGDDKGGSAAPTAGGSAAAGGLLRPGTQASRTPRQIGLITDGAGPAVDLRVQNRVAEATVKYLNERKGGIGGHPIELTICETQGDPAKGTDCGNKLVEENVVGAMIGTSAVVMTAWEP